MFIPKKQSHSGNPDLTCRRHRTVMHGNSIRDYKRSEEEGTRPDPTSVSERKPLRTYDRKRKIKVEIKTEPHF